VLDEWIDEVCSALRIDPDDVDVTEILDLARDAAHLVERRAAPVTTYLVGVAAGRRETPDAASEAAGAVAALLKARR
jgi:Domain of unknown function (DUF6457)